MCRFSNGWLRWFRLNNVVRIIVKSLFYSVFHCSESFGRDYAPTPPDIDYVVYFIN